MYDKETEEIIAYTKESKNGRRWIDYEKEFTKERNWSKGKFVAHWKEAKQYLEKIKDSDRKGRFRYQVKSQFTSLAEKASLKQTIDKQEIWKVKINEEEIRKIFGVSHDILSYQLKRFTKEEQFFNEAIDKEFSIALATKYLEIFVNYPAETKQPDMIKKEIGVAALVILLRHLLDNRDQEFSITLHYNPVNVNLTNRLHDQIMDVAFPKWLKRRKIDVLKISKEKKNKLRVEFEKKAEEYSIKLLRASEKKH